MLDVLEHLPNPVVYLRRAEELLDLRGNLLITVPAFSCLWTTHDELNHHVATLHKKGSPGINIAHRPKNSSLSVFFSLGVSC